MTTFEHFTGWNPRVTTGFDGWNSNLVMSTSIVRRVGGTSTLAGSNGTGRFVLRTPSGGFHVVCVAYVYWNAFYVGAPGDALVSGIKTSGSGSGGVGYNVANNQFCVAYEVAGSPPTPFFVNPGGPTLSLNTWYRVEYHLDTSANPWLIDVQVAVGDGPATSLTQVSVANAALTLNEINSLCIGAGFGTETTGDFWSTDFAYSTQAADYPIGPIQVIGYSPNAVGVHNLDAATSSYFFKEVSGVDTALTTSETTSYQTIDDVPLSLDADSIFVQPVGGTPTIDTPAFRSAGSWAFTGNNVSNTSLSPGAPAGKAVGDLLVLVGETRSITATAATPSGWDLVAGFPKRSGSLSGGSIYVWTRVADGTANDTPSVAWSGLTTGTSGDSTGVGILAFQNATEVTDASSTSQDLSAQGASSTIAGLTSATDKSLILNIAMKILESSGQTSSVSNYTEASDNSTTSGTGHIVQTSYMVKTPAGASGSGTITWSATGSARALIATLALKATTTIPLTQPTNTWYAEYQFADETTLGSAPLAVRPIVAVNLDSAISSKWVAKLYDGVNVEDIYNATISSASKTYIGKVFSQRPNTGGAWTLAALNALRIQFGYTDLATGHPRIEAAMIEAVYPVSSGTAYTESATISSKTTVTSTDVDIYASVDATVISHATAISASEIYTPAAINYTESATINSKTTPTALDISSYVDSGTLNTVVSLSTIEPTNYVESSTISSTTTPSSSEIYTARKTTPIYRTRLSSGSTPTSTSPQTLYIWAWKLNPTDSGILRVSLYQSGTLISTNDFTLTDTETAYSVDESTSVTDWSDVEIEIQGISDIGADLSPAVGTIDFQIPPASVTSHTYTESATISTKSDVVSIELEDSTDSSIITSGTLLTTSEIDVFVDSATITAVTSFTSLDQQLHETNDLSTISTITVLAANEVAGYLDPQTIAGSTSVQYNELHEIPDTNTIAGITQIVSQEVASYLDSNVFASTTTLTYSEGKQVTESATLLSTSQILSQDIASFVEASTVATHNSLTSTEGAIVELGTVSGLTTITTFDIAAYVDRSVTLGITSILAADSFIALDSSLVSTMTSLSSQDLADYTDNAILQSATIVVADELHTISDSSLITSTTVPLYSEIAGFVDSAELATVTSITADEGRGAANSDSATVDSDTELVTIDLYSTIEQAVVESDSDAQTSDFSAYQDSAAGLSVTSVNSNEGQQNVFADNSTISAKSVATSIDVMASIDSNTINSSSAVESADAIDLVDSSNISSSTRIVYSDTSVFADSSSLATKTFIGSTEFQGIGVQDSATISSINSVTYTESAQYVETPQVVNSSTSASSTEIASFFDSATAGTTTLLSTQEGQEFTFVDASTIESITYISAEEFYKITIVILEGIISFNWNSLFNRRWAANLVKVTNILVDATKEAGQIQRWSKEWKH